MGVLRQLNSCSLRLHERGKVVYFSGFARKINHPFISLCEQSEHKTVLLLFKILQVNDKNKNILS
jgi:hypothetical protein